MTGTTYPTSGSYRIRGKVASLLEGLVQGQDKMKGIMKMALSGRKMQPQELLALQAACQCAERHHAGLARGLGAQADQLDVGRCLHHRQGVRRTA